MEKEERAELLLAYLVECVDEAGHNYFFFDINHFANKAEVGSFEDVMAALLFLEGEGLVVPVAGAFGELSAMITDAGLVFAENGGSTGVIGRYRDNPAPFMKGGAPQAAEAGDLREKLLLGPRIYDLMTTMVERVKADPSLSKGEVEDFLKDVEVLNLQLGRQSRNEGLITSLLAGMEQIEGIRNEVAELGALVARYVK